MIKSEIRLKEPFSIHGAPMSRLLLTEKEKYSQSVHIFVIKYIWKMNASGGLQPYREEGASHVSVVRQERRGVLTTKTISQHTSDMQAKMVPEKEVLRCERQTEM